MRRFFLALVALLILWVTRTVAAPDEPATIELSFDAADQTPYVLETATNIAVGMAWHAFTNFPPGPARMVTTMLATLGENRYFRLTSPSTNLSIQPFLQVGHELRFITNSIVIPSGTENSFGNATGGLFRSPVDFQTFYSRSNFLSSQTDRLTILGIAFRIDEATSHVDVIPSKVGIWLSTFTENKLSRFRAENWGSDRTLVYFHQNVHFTGLRNTNDVSNFQIHIPFDQPFTYDPTKGDLVIDFYTERPYVYGHGGFADGIIRNDGSIFSIGDGTFNGIKPYGTILKVIYRVQLDSPLRR